MNTHHLMHQIQNFVDLMASHQTLPLYHPINVPCYLYTHLEQMKQHVNYTAAFRDQLNNHLVVDSPVTISLFPTSIDLDPIFEKDRDLDRFRFSYRAGQSVMLNTSGGPGATLDRRVMQLSAQLLLSPRIRGLS